MVLFRYCLMVFLVSMGLGVVGLDARHRKSELPRCKSEENCLNNPDCTCYCSGIGNFRNKNDKDKPVFVAKDKNRKYCYCKQWDLDNFPYAERPADEQ